MRGFLKTQIWIGFQPIRSFNSTNPCLKVDKALLSKLRKQTGVPFINCKKALEKFDNNFDESKKWLLEEAQRAGWARATKLSARPMAQGLIALLGDHEGVTMLEVNCETDFVAKNEKFVSMVQHLTEECKGHFESKNKKMIFATKEELNQIESKKDSISSTLYDKVALCIGELGENISLRRGAFVRAEKDSSLCFYAHPSAPGKRPKGVQLGKYGAIVEMHGFNQSGKPAVKLADFGSRLCQHIVGMNPKTIGKSISATDVREVKEDETDDWRNQDQDADDTDDTEVRKKIKQEKEEEALLQQDFILDPSMKVGEFAALNGVEVKGFVRYACGEEIEGEE